MSNWFCLHVASQHMASVTRSITSQSTRRSLGGRGMLVRFTCLFCCCCCYIQSDIHTYIIFVKAYIILAKLCGNAASVADTLKLGNFFPSTVKKDQVTYFRRLLKKTKLLTSVDADLFKGDRPNFPIKKTTTKNTHSKEYKKTLHSKRK